MKREEKVVMSKLIFALILIPSALCAQEHSHPSSERLGTVHFPVSCSMQAVPHFDRAVALLHSFEFGAAITGFNQALAADSTCAMAYWGIALSRWGNPMAAGNRSGALLSAGLDAVSSARRVAYHATAREKAFIDAAAKLFEGSDRIAQDVRVRSYEAAMSGVAGSNPDDIEARIFYALSIVAAAPASDKTYANQTKAAQILEPLWKKYPDHPGLAHYIIHTFDYPSLAKRGSDAAREYAVIAPSTPHAMHMPSHIFTRTGMWKESIETNLKSMQLAENAGSIAEVLHAADYAEYAYLQLGRNAEAKRIVEKLPGLAARFDVNAVTGAAPGSAGVFALAAIPARYALERNAWAEAAELKPSPSTFRWTDALTWFARALGASHLRDTARARTAVDSLEAIEHQLASANEPYWTEQVAIQSLGARAWLDFARGRHESAEALMREAVRREDATEKSAVTPGPLAPSRELLADMLMEMGRKKEALVEYRKTLEVEPSRRRSMEGVRLAQR
jgi:tetratricopeptide (TPR) repeat protein